MSAEVRQATKHSVEPTIDESGQIIPPPVCVNEFVQVGKSLVEVAEGGCMVFGTVWTETGGRAIIGCTACKLVNRCKADVDGEMIITEVKTEPNGLYQDSTGCPQAVETKVS